jgi:hypothetical protein
MPPASKAKEKTRERVWRESCRCIGQTLKTVQEFTLEKQRSPNDGSSLLNKSTRTILQVRPIARVVQL